MDGNPRYRVVWAMRLFFSALQAFLQGITKICEGEGRKLQVRSLRYGVEESAQVPLLPIHPPNPTLSGPIGQGWTCQDPAALGVQPAAWCLQPQQWRPPSSRLWMGDVAGRKPHLGRSQLPAARQFFSKAFSLGSDHPFPGLWPLPSRGRIDHLVNEALGSKFLQLRSQMQLVGILFGHVRLWFLNSELVSRFLKGKDFTLKSTYCWIFKYLATLNQLLQWQLDLSSLPLFWRDKCPQAPQTAPPPFQEAPAALAGAGGGVWIFHPAGKFHVWATSCSLPTLSGPSFLLPLAVGTSAHIPVPSAPALICSFGTVGGFVAENLSKFTPYPKQLRSRGVLWACCCSNSPPGDLDWSQGLVPASPRPWA